MESFAYEPKKRHNEAVNEIKEIQAAAEPLFKNSNVAFAAVFGSVAKGNATAASDIDMVVRFRAPVGLLAFFALQRQLEDALGKPVDLVTERSLDARLKDRILRELTPIYGSR